MYVCMYACMYVCMYVCILRTIPCIYLLHDKSILSSNITCCEIPNVGALTLIMMLGGTSSGEQKATAPSTTTQANLMTKMLKTEWWWQAIKKDFCYFHNI